MLTQAIEVPSDADAALLVPGGPDAAWLARAAWTWGCCVTPRRAADHYLPAHLLAPLKPACDARVTPDMQVDRRAIAIREYADRVRYVFGIGRLVIIAREVRTVEADMLRAAGASVEVPCAIHWGPESIPVLVRLPKSVVETTLPDPTRRIVTAIEALPDMAKATFANAVAIHVGAETLAKSVESGLGRVAEAIEAPTVLLTVGPGDDRRLCGLR